MPQRKGLRTFDTSDVQGDESWIVVRSMTVGEILAMRRELESRDNVLYKIGVFFGRLLQRAPPETVRTLRYLKQSIRYVQAWNWVDNEGAPLSSPADEPDVVNHLTDDEMACIIACVQGDRQSVQQKN